MNATTVFHTEATPHGYKVVDDRGFAIPTLLQKQSHADALCNALNGATHDNGPLATDAPCVTEGCECGQKASS